MLTTHRMILIAFAIVLAACTNAFARPSAAEGECTGPGMQAARGGDPNAVLVGSFPTTAGQFVKWEESSSQFVKAASPQRNRPPAERLVMCYYDGEFLGATQPAPPSGTRLPNYDRLLVAVMADGSTRVVIVGHRATMPVQGPTLP